MCKYSILALCETPLIHITARRKREMQFVDWGNAQLTCLLNLSVRESNEVITTDNNNNNIMILIIIYNEGK